MGIWSVMAVSTLVLDMARPESLDLHFFADFASSLVCLPWLEAELGRKCWCLCSSQSVHTVMVVFPWELVLLPPSVP